MIIELQFSSFLHDDQTNTMQTLLSEFKDLNTTKNPVNYLNSIQFVEVVGNIKYYSIRTKINATEFEEHENHDDYETAVNIFYNLINLYQNKLLS